MSAESNRINLDIDINLPVIIELTRANVSVNKSDTESYVNLEYSPFDKIKPEIILKKTDVNHISFKNTEIVKVNAVFFLPADIRSLEIHVNDGDIQAEGLSKNLDLQVDSGDIKVLNCEGFFNGVSFNGSVKVISFNGEMNIHSTNGSIKIINWDKAGGNIQSDNGQIIIGVKTIIKELDARSKNSKVSIGLTNNCPCTIIARGTDVIKYMNRSFEGEFLGSPSKYEWEGGGVEVKLFSASSKVVITTNDFLNEISPDLESIFKEFETAFKENFDMDELKESFKEFGKKLENLGKNFADNMQKMFSDAGKRSRSANDKEKTSSVNSEKMEVLKLLKEGKITADEAEKLINALK